MDDEAELVEQAKRGNDYAFGKLYVLYAHDIQRFLQNMLGDPETAQNLGQDTFIKAWQKLHTLDNVSCFRSWIYKIARNEAYDHFEREKREEDIIKKWHLYNQTGFIRGKESMLLELALELVPPNYRECIILHDIQGFTQSEIAQIIKSHQRRVCRFLKAGYKELKQAYERLDSIDHLCRKRV